MNKSTLLKISYLLVVFFGLTNMAFADDMPLKCPTTEQLRQYEVIDDFSFSFNQQTQAIQSIVYLSKPFVTNEDDDENNDFNWRDARWELTMMNLPVLKGENISTVATRTIEKLAPVSTEPFLVSQDDLEYHSVVSTCVYTLPGDPNLSVFASHLGFEDMNAAKAYLKKKKSRASRLKKILKK